MDQRQKWQRITEWIAHDSTQAAAVSKQDSSHGGSTSARATAGSSSGHLQEDQVPGTSAHAYRVLSPGMEAIESVAELRYSLDTTLVDLEQHAMVQAAAAAAAAAVLAAGPARQTVLPAAAAGAGPGPQQQQQPLLPISSMQQAAQAVQLQQQQQPAEATAFQPAPVGEISITTLAAPAAAEVPALPHSASDSSAMAAQQLLALQHQLLQEGQQRQQAQQLAAQLQQQVQDLLQQQEAAGRSFQQQLQQVREAAAADLQLAQQVRVQVHSYIHDLLLGRHVVILVVSALLHHPVCTGLRMLCAAQ